SFLVPVFRNPRCASTTSSRCCILPLLPFLLLCQMLRNRPLNLLRLCTNYRKSVRILKGTGRSIREDEPLPPSHSYPVASDLDHLGQVEHFTDKVEIHCETSDAVEGG